MKSTIIWISVQSVFWCLLWFWKKKLKKKSWKKKKIRKMCKKKKCFTAPPQVICLQQGLYESEHKSMQAYRKSHSLQECYFSEKFSKHMNISGYICLICLVLISCTSSPTICWVCSLTVWSHTNWTPLWFTSKTPVCSNR